MRLLILVLSLHICFSFSGQTLHHGCQAQKNKVPLRGGSVLTDPGNLRSDSLDILKYDLTLDMTQMNAQLIAASCRVDIKSLLDNMTYIHLDLAGLTVDSVTYAGGNLTFDHQGENLLVYFPAALNTNDTFSCTVHYHGTPQSDLTWGGFYFTAGYAYNLGVGFTSVPHNFGRVWFPCFDNFVERSAFEFHVLTNLGRTSYCNGMRTSVETVGQDSLLTHWKLDESIPSYLACVAVTNYTHAESSFQSITGTTIPIWLTAKAQDTTDMKLSFVNLSSALTGFEEAYGPYRWPKVGYSAVPFSSGAMEHATNIAYPVATIDGTTAYETLYAHELSHHWWGDLVTCRNAGDMWLNEGWASYSESIFLEKLYGESAYIDNVRNNHKDALLYAHRNDNGIYPVSGVPTNITYGDHVYIKGADIAHTLRGYMGDESFFNGLRDLTESKQFSTNTSEGLRDFMQTYTSEDLTLFFDNWVFEPGFPEFRIRQTTNTSANQWQVNIDQFKHNNDFYYDAVPMQLTALSTNGQRFSQTIHLSGSTTVADMNLPEGFVPDHFMLNENDAISEAVLPQNRTLIQGGVGDFTYAELSGNVNDIGTQDSVFMRVENHWAAADENLVQGDYYISPDRWWDVYHTGDDSFDMSATIRYYGHESDTKYFDPLLFDYIIANQYNEDSLKLLYRPNGNSTWQLCSDYQLLTAPGLTNWTGKFIINHLQSGQYAFAVPTGATAVLEQEKSDVQIFSNRSKVFVRTGHQIGRIEILSEDGRMIVSESVNGNLELSTNQWATGIYIVKWVEQGGATALVQKLYISGE